MSLHTLRGRVPASTKKTIIIDDGRLNHGMKVKEFHVWGVDYDSHAEMALCLNEINAGAQWDASNGNQIAWACQSGAIAPPPSMSHFSLIDPNHVVIQDLIINNFGITDGNYLVILEQIKLSDDQAIIALIKERQQDDL